MEHIKHEHTHTHYIYTRFIFSNSHLHFSTHLFACSSALAHSPSHHITSQFEFNVIPTKLQNYKNSNKCICLHLIVRMFFFLHFYYFKMKNNNIKIIAKLVSIVCPPPQFVYAFDVFVYILNYSLFCPPVLSPLSFTLFSLSSSTSSYTYVCKAHNYSNIYVMRNQAQIAYAIRPRIE